MYRWLRSRRARKAPRRLVFAPLAWLKLQWFCHAGPVEIGGFGIAAAENLLLVQEFLTVPQVVSPASVCFEDGAVADYIDACVDRGLRPEQFARIWCHTHPGASVVPSLTDEDTFARVFGACDWALMFILGRTGRTLARLQFTAGPGLPLAIPVAVDWSAWPAALDVAKGDLGSLVEHWQAEYAANIQDRVLPPASRRCTNLALMDDLYGWAETWLDSLDEPLPPVLKESFSDDDCF